MENEATIEWNVLEYQYKEKRINWYVAFAIAIISASSTAFLLGNILFGIFIIIAAFTLAMHSVKKPEIINVRINDDGVIINNDLYKYSTLKSFWVEESTVESKVILSSDKFLMPYVTIPLGEINGDEVRDFLSIYLEEIEHVEPITHKAMEYLGF